MLRLDRTIDQPVDVLVEGAGGRTRHPGGGRGSFRRPDLQSCRYRSRSELGDPGRGPVWQALCAAVVGDGDPPAISPAVDVPNSALRHAAMRALVRPGAGGGRVRPGQDDGLQQRGRHPAPRPAWGAGGRIAIDLAAAARRRFGLGWSRPRSGFRWLASPLAVCGSLCVLVALAAPGGDARGVHGGPAATSAIGGVFGKRMAGSGCFPPRNP